MVNQGLFCAMALVATFVFLGWILIDMFQAISKPTHQSSVLLDYDRETKGYKAQLIE